jgi:hypothetical protein
MRQYKQCLCRRECIVLNTIYITVFLKMEPSKVSKNVEDIKKLKIKILIY